MTAALRRGPRAVRRPSVAALPGLLLGLLLLTAACQRGPQELDVEITVRGHREVLEENGGGLVPWSIGRRSLGFCFDLPAELAGGEWEGLLVFGDRTAGRGYAIPAATMGSTLCFDDPVPTGLPDGSLAVCGRLVERRSGREYELPCREVQFRREDGIHEDLERRLRVIPAAHGSDGLEAMLEDYDASAREARDLRYPALAVRFELAAITALRQADELARARQRSTRLPAWLDLPEASGLGSDAALEAALLELHKPSRALPLLRQAEQRGARVAHPGRVGAATARASLQAAIGGFREAQALLEEALAACDRSPCNATMQLRAQGQLGTLIALNPDADDHDLRAAERRLSRALGGLSTDAAPVRATELVLALARIQLRLGRDAGPLLERARRLLETAGRRGQRLRDEILLIAGLQALSEGRTGKSLEHCQRITVATRPTNVARALSCVAQALRAEADPRTAMQAFAAALERYEAAARDSATVEDPAWRADDFARAARLAVELGQLPAAWGFLERLDNLTVGERHRAACRDRGGPCPPRAPATRQPVQFRAVALPEEVLLLRRQGDQDAVLERRTPLLRSELVRLLREGDAFLARRDEDTIAWRDLTAPLAEALVPAAPESLPEITTFALHGVLQRVPLAALGAGDGWLADHTVVALRPVGLAPPPASPGGPPLMVLARRGDGEDERYAAAFFQRSLPAATLLTSDDATGDAVARALPQAGALHFEGRGRFERAAPGASLLLLPDRPMSLAESLPGRLRFAFLGNLALPAWQPSEDSGEYGLGGLFARRGAAWVIFHLSPPDPQVARQLADGFYRALLEQRNVPKAYGAALRELRQQRPLADWARFILLQGSRDPSPAPDAPP
ncbi:MAG: CHAT domain-containing protein [Acidobacteriota bacterium]